MRNFKARPRNSSKNKELCTGFVGKRNQCISDHLFLLASQTKHTDEEEGADGRIHMGSEEWTNKIYGKGLMSLYSIYIS